MSPYTTRPLTDEYAEYYGTYIDQAPDGSIVETLRDQGRSTLSFLDSIPAERERHRYAADKWSIREVVGHVIDSERMFAMRALAFARNDPARFPPFDDKDYAKASGADERSLSELAHEFETVRAATVSLFAGLAPAAWDRRGIASDREFSVRSLAWIIAGHCVHHMDVVRNRYLDSGGP